MLIQLLGHKSKVPEGGISMTSEGHAQSYAARAALNKGAITLLGQVFKCWLGPSPPEVPEFRP